MSDTRQLLVRGVTFTFDRAERDGWEEAYESRDFVGLWAVLCEGNWAVGFHDSDSETGSLISQWHPSWADLSKSTFLDSLALFVRSARNGELEVAS